MKNVFLSFLISSAPLSSCIFAEHAQEIQIPRTEKTVNVFLVGTGLVGGALLKQIENNHDLLKQRYGIDIHVAGLANSHTMGFNPDGIPLKTWAAALGDFMSWDDYFSQMLSLKLPNTIFVDCTSDARIASTYSAILKAGISVVTPNKKANSGSMDSYLSLQEIKAGKFLYDANVGAGLPIVSTVQGLMRSGDSIVKIEAILSGTLSYLFNSFQDGMKFSDLVRDAQKKGYTEPDPRDDLNGMDVARKLLILARESGLALSMKDIDSQRFLPDACFDAPSIEEFYVKLASFDATMTQRQKQAAAEGKKLRYIASMENGKLKISLQAVGPEHPFYGLSGTDNIVSIHTNYYNKNPLVIRGPGAGADVTAARVLEGIVRAGLENQ